MKPKSKIVSLLTSVFAPLVSGSFKYATFKIKSSNGVDHPDL